mmetsp:Transcript_9099/g.17365  ORF Transcript_9099/g.17365 Transcript_9099/m.17365 type:complete len:85 (+) Transcript_9099:2-256(+)
MEHFVYLPRKATANPQDIPFFLSTRLEDDAVVAAAADTGEDVDTAFVADFALDATQTDPVRHLVHYEKQAADLAAEYERQMVRF